MQDAKTSGGAHLSPAVFWIVAGFFLLSGLSSLIYQIIWTRLLVFVFGSTTFATSTVLAVFMGGLAIGSFVAGKKADSLKRPFYWYGILEAIIGVWALATPSLLAAALPIYKTLFQSLHEQQLLFGLVRFLVASIVLLPPTACMGATLPLLSRFITSSLSTVGDRIGTLYSLNTLGAVIGSVAAGFLLLPVFGLNATTLIAATINILLGASVLMVARRLEVNSVVSVINSDEISSEDQTVAHSDSLVHQSSIDTAKKEPVSGKLSQITIVTMLSFGVSGALAMIYEVAWTRCLLMVIGSTTYAFSVMLCTFLLGIFLGSYLCARVVDKIRSPILYFALAETGICFGAFVSLVLFSCLPYWNLLFAVSYPNDQSATMFFRFLSAGMIMLPITLFLGAIFPITVKICANDLQRIGNSIGNLYSVNTIGAIVGAFLAGFVVIPRLGAEQALIVTSVANLMLGIVLLLIYGKLRNAIRAFVCVGAIVVLCWTASKPEIWDRALVNYGQAQRRQIVGNPKSANLNSLQEWKNTLASRIETLFYKDGICSSVAVAEMKNPAVRVLFTNGHADASDLYDMENQALLAAFPLLLKPDAKDICVVGWGSGVTAGYALQFPIKRMVAVELEPAVIDTSEFFHRVNFVPEKDPRTQIEPSDGRNFLLCTPEKYDVIVSEPSNPWQAGVCNLFTKEYFEIAKNSLKPGGIFTMWSQINEMPTAGLIHILAALRDIFPHVLVFDSGSGDVCALASMEPFKISPEILEKSFANEKVRAAMAPYHLNSFDDFLSRIIMSPEGVEKSIGQVPANGDDKNFLEYDIARSYENAAHRPENSHWIFRNQGPVWNFVSWERTTPEGKALEYARVAQHCLLRNPSRAISWATASIKERPTSFAFSIVVQAFILQNNFDKAVAVLDDAARMVPIDARIRGLRGMIALRRSDYVKAQEELTLAVKQEPSNSFYRFLLAQTYSPLDTGQQVFFQEPESTDPSKVIALTSIVENDQSFVKQQPAVLFVLGKAYIELGKNEDAIRILSTAVKQIPDAFLPWRLLGQAYATQKNWAKANYCYDRSSALVASQLPKLINDAVNSLNSGDETSALQKFQMALEMSPSNKTAMEHIAELSKKNANAKMLYEKMTKTVVK